LAADTTRKPSVDTMAYILLDTNTNIIWQYKKAVNNAWTRVGGSISSGLTGVLPVANGGTNASTFTAGSVVFAGTSGTSLAEDNANLFWNNSTKRLGIGVTPSYKLDILGSESMTSTITRAINIIDFDTHTSGSNKFQQTYSLNANQNVPTGTTNGGYIYGQSFSVSAGSTAPADSSNSGTLNNVTGIQMSFGITNAFNNPTVNSARGLSITPFAQSGNISELASLRLNNVSGTAGTITNNYAIYQESSVQKNYFAGNVGIGQTTPTAILHLKSGTATAAPIRLTSSGATLLSSLESGAIEFNGTNLLFTPSTTRHTVNHGLTGSATLEFLSTNAQNSRDMTITVTGAAEGDVVSLGVPNAAVNANTSYSAWVSAANTVTVRFNNYSSGTVDPASGLFKVFVTK